MSFPNLPVYPDVITGIPGVIPFDYTAAQPILKTEFASGRESRRAVWSSPRRNVTIFYKRLTVTQANSFWEFYRSMEGPLSSFVFYFPHERVYYEESFGSSSGTEDIINLPCKGLQTGESFLLQRGHVVLNYPSDYTLSLGTGPNGEDQADLDTPGSVGQTYFFSFTGKLKIKTRFSEKPIRFVEEKTLSTDITVRLIGLQGDMT